MKRKYVAEIIYEFLEERYPEWHAGYEFCNKEVYVKGQRYWLGSSSDRKARKLAESNKIDKDYKGRYVYFRAKPKQSEQLKMAINNDKILTMNKLKEKIVEDFKNWQPIKEGLYIPSEKGKMMVLGFLLQSLSSYEKEIAGEVVGEIGAELLARHSPQAVLDVYFDVANKELEKYENENDN